MDFGYIWFQLMTAIVPVMAFTILGVALIRTIREWHRNENSPRLRVEAKIVCKRSDYRRTMNHRVHGHRSARTNYFVTFEFESGDRMELALEGHQYGLLVEGDRGSLTFQGSRFLGFERK